jgi:hypothetical protein
MRGGAAAAYQQQVEQKKADFKAAAENFKVAAEDCKQKRLSGELKTYVESVQCSNPALISSYRNAGYPYMDLIELLAASRLVGAERIDKHEMTEAELQLQMAELNSRVTAEAQRRTLAMMNANSQSMAAHAQAQSAQAQSTAVMLQGLSAFQPRQPVVCSGTAMKTGNFATGTTVCN